MELEASTFQPLEAYGENACGKAVLARQAARIDPLDLLPPSADGATLVTEVRIDRPLTAEITMLEEHPPL
jgi:hypothetical protein